MRGPGDVSTSVLLDRARSGDRGALEDLFARELPRLRRWAHGRVPPSVRATVDTDDLIQTTVLKTLGRLTSFESRGPGAFYAYLRQALLNRIRDEARASASRGSEELPSDTVDPRPLPLEEAIGTEALARYEAALARLKDEEREAIVARVEMGCSYEDVMTLLGKPTVDAARMCVGRALLRLAREMSRG